MTHGSNGRHQAGGLLALLASGSLLLAAGAAVARPDCADWNTYQFFEQATAADVAHCLSEGADPNARDENGYTPLHRMGVRALGNDEVTMALLNETPAVVKVLVDAGADLEARAELGLTPLHVAARNNKNPLEVEALLDAGADPRARTHKL